MFKIGDVVMLTFDNNIVGYPMEMILPNGIKKRIPFPVLGQGVIVDIDEDGIDDECIYTVDFEKEEFSLECRPAWITKPT